MRQLATLWKFSRPHTVIGSVVSICTLYVIACHDKAAHLPLLLQALVIGVGSNIFIVGINQIADVSIDRINKPHLPIPAGELTLTQARFIVYTALAVSLGLAWYVTPYVFLIIFLSTFIGWAYSMPPLYLKRHHLPAALAISTVRGVLVNIGGFLAFNHLLNHSTALPGDVRILALFIIVFSIVIAWFKDLPDMEGDARHHIRTLAILYSPRFTLLAGNLLIGLAYLFTIAAKYLDRSLETVPAFRTQVMLYGHILLFALFVLNSASVNLMAKASVKKFYKRFWWFFFAEYLLYLLAYLG